MQYEQHKSEGNKSVVICSSWDPLGIRLRRLRLFVVFVAGPLSLVFVADELCRWPSSTSMLARAHTLCLRRLLPRTGPMMMLAQGDNTSASCAGWSSGVACQPESCSWGWLIGTGPLDGRLQVGASPCGLGEGAPPWIIRRPFLIPRPFPR